MTEKTFAANDAVGDGTLTVNFCRGGGAISSPFSLKYDRAGVPGMSISMSRSEAKALAAYIVENL